MIFGDKIFPEDFWQNVNPEPNTGCWLWSGGKSGRRNGSGYGRYRLKPAERQHVHVLMCTAVYGKSDLHALHSCDMPLCVNPDHLRWGTPGDNIRDMISRKRRKKRRLNTHCRRNHPLTEDNVYARPSGGRNCRICLDMWIQQYRLKVVTS